MSIADLSTAPESPAPPCRRSLHTLAGLGHVAARRGLVATICARSRAARSATSLLTSTPSCWSRSRFSTGLSHGQCTNRARSRFSTARTSSIWRDRRRREIMSVILNARPEVACVLHVDRSGAARQPRRRSPRKVSRRPSSCCAFTERTVPTTDEVAWQILAGVEERPTLRSSTGRWRHDLSRSSCRSGTNSVRRRRDERVIVPGRARIPVREMAPRFLGSAAERRQRASEGSVALTSQRTRRLRHPRFRAIPIDFGQVQDHSGSGAYTRSTATFAAATADEPALAASGRPSRSAGARASGNTGRLKK